MKYVLSIIDQDRDEWYKPPTIYYKQKRVDFKYQSYRRSAIDEVKLYLMTYPDQNPIEVIEQFRNMVNNFSCTANSEQARWMFSIYYDVATDILDVVVGIK